MNTVVLDLKGLDILVAYQAVKTKVLFVKIENDELKVIASQSNVAQMIIDELAAHMPDLVPVQFHYMLNRYGLDDAIAILLPALKTENLEKYAMYKAYLEQARFYEFSKAFSMFNDIKDKLIKTNENLDFTLQQLKSMWTEASGV